MSKMTDCTWLWPQPSHLGMVADCHTAHDDAVAQAHTITDDAALANANIRAQLAVHTNLGSGGNQHLEGGGEGTCGN